MCILFARIFEEVVELILGLLSIPQFVGVVGR